MLFTSLTSPILSSSVLGTGLPSASDLSNPGQAVLQSLNSLDQGYRDQLRFLRYQLRESMQSETAENIAKKLDEQSRLVFMQMQILSQWQMPFNNFRQHMSVSSGSSVASTVAPAATKSGIVPQERDCVFLNLKRMRNLCKELQNASVSKGMGNIKEELDLIFDAVHMECMGKIKAIKNGTTEVKLTKTFLSASDKSLAGYSVELMLTNPKTLIRLEASKFEDIWLKGIVDQVYNRYTYIEKFVNDLIRIKKSKSAGSKKVSE